jgi:S-layer protein
LTAGNLAQLTGGAGVDTFVMTTILTNVNSYATIMDPLSGDKIDGAAGAFKSAVVTLGGTAVFADLANAAVNGSTANNDMLWFQFGGDTYIIQDNATGGATYNAAADTIIKLTGLIDLATASFNATNGVLELA